VLNDLKHFYVQSSSTGVEDKNICR